MKQVSNSLLTLLSIPFKTLPYALAPRENANSCGRHLTPFFAYRENAGECCFCRPGLSCPPRSLVRIRLGEGRIRNLFHGISLSLTILFMASMSVRENQAAAHLAISLKEDVAVESKIIFLKDVADLRGPDSGLLQRLAQTRVATAPAFGETSILNRHQIIRLIEPVSGHLPADAISGASAVQIRLRGRPVREEEIDSILKANISETTPWRESEITVRSIGNINGIELPPVDGELRISSKASITGQRRILAPIEILSAGKSVRSIWISADISIRSVVLTAAKRILSGKIITPQDVVKKLVEIKDLRASYVRNPADILGKASRRSFSPGDPLVREDFTDPLLVKHGETVRLRLERDGIVLTSLVKAEQDGKLGQTIRVRNMEFSTLLQAEVTGRAEVKMP
jgi:flagella basal body P-ring formation protein FlgA